MSHTIEINVGSKLRNSVNSGGAPWRPRKEGVRKEAKRPPSWRTLARSSSQSRLSSFASEVLVGRHSEYGPLEHVKQSSLLKEALD
jgi:hypothetical protein